MTSTADLSKLTSALPDGISSVDAGDLYAVDGVLPSVVVKPETQEEVAQTLAAANAAGAAVVPFGGGTQQHLGMPPERYDVALDLRHLDALIEHEPADLTVTVEAGLRLSALQRLLAERGQWLPLDPPLGGEATIGGVLATNASGPARLSRGTARDLVIGMTVATAQGQIVKSGGRVAKNVAGYDLAKLHIGALGTTGVILQASFKVAPLPVRTAMVVARGDLAALVRLSRAIEDGRLALQGSVLGKDAREQSWRLALRFAAGEAAVERSLREASSLAAASSTPIDDARETEWLEMLPAYDSSATVARVSVLPTEMPGVVEMLASAGASVSALPGVGVAHAMWSDNADTQRLRVLREACESKHDAFVVEKASLETRRSFDAWGTPAGGFELMRRLKQELDPNRVLNPGRFVGGI